MPSETASPMQQPLLVQPMLARYSTQLPLTTDNARVDVDGTSYAAHFTCCDIAKALINIATQHGAPSDFTFCRLLMKLDLPAALIHLLQV
jgi:hypothetical protein